MRNLPISIQTFENIILGDLIYVDKTNFIYKMASKGKYYFLARPRRFGKSLLLTTLKAYFQGKKELFKGLYIYEKEKDWTIYPVVHIDYSLVTYKEGKAIFHQSLLTNLKRIGNDYDIKLTHTIVGDAFVELVQKLEEKFQKKVVVLVDEYDKPMVDFLTKPKRFEENREILRSLYTNFKGLDGSLRFVMLTGVSRFSKVSVFSGLNNLYDISNDNSYSTIVGFTQKELENNFEPHLAALQQEYPKSRAELMQSIKINYNGFSFDGIHKLYNPFSILALLQKKKFDNFWFSTGTPTFLMNIIVQHNYLPETFENIKVYDLVGSTMRIEKLPLIPLLYQTGYLTIVKRELDDIRYIYYLNYPNEEVRHSFLTYIAAAFKDIDEVWIQPEGIALREALMEERVDDFIQKLQSFLADIPARLHIPREAYYHSLTYLILRVVGFKLILEKETDKGRINAVLELKDKIYIIEFKFATNKRVKRVTTLSRNALKQIETKKYYEPYLGHNKKVILLGVGFLDSKLNGRSKMINL